MGRTSVGSKVCVPKTLYIRGCGFSESPCSSNSLIIWIVRLIGTKQGCLQVFVLKRCMNGIELGGRYPVSSITMVM